MICPKCNSDNKPGALYCTECGGKLTPEADKTVVDNASDMVPMEDLGDDVTYKVNMDDIPANETTGMRVQPAPNEKSEMSMSVAPAPAAPVPQAPPMPPIPPKDDSDDSTTVLKSNMVIGGEDVAANGSPKPAAFAPAPTFAPLPVATPPLPVGAPVAAPANSAAPAKKEKKAKKSKGTKVYIVISIILMVAMAGAIGYGYYYFSKKIDDNKKEHEAEIEEINVAHQTEVDLLNEDLSAAQTEADELQDQLDAKDDEITSLTLQMEELQANSTDYSQYDTLIGFVETHPSQGCDTFAASNTVLTIAPGTEKMLVYVYHSQDGTCFAQSNNEDSVVVSWPDEGEDYGSYFPLYVTALEPGEAVITLTTDTGEDPIEIFVLVK